MRSFLVAVLRFGLAAVTVALLNSAAVATSASALSVSAEGSEITLEVRGATRREAVERLFSGHGIVVEWSNEAVADEAISGRYKGSLEKIALLLLARTNFIVAYGAGSSEPRIARIIVLGRGSRSPGAVPSPRDQIVQARPATARPASADERRSPTWVTALKRMQATDAAVRKRTAELGQGGRIIRSQAVTRTQIAGAARQGRSIPVVPARTRPSQ